MTVFCSEQDVMGQVPIVQGFTSRYSLLIPGLITSVSEQIRTFCRRDFDKKERIVYKQSPDTVGRGAPYRLQLKEPPVEAGTLFIYYDSMGLFTDYTMGGTYELMEDVDFTIDYPTGKIEIITQSLTYSPRGLKYVYTGGYPPFVGNSEIAQVPEPVKLACSMQTAFMLQRVASSQTGQVQSEDDSKDSRTFSGGAISGMLNEVQLLLAPYRMIMTGRG